VAHDEQPEQTTLDEHNTHRADAQHRALAWAKRAEEHHVQALNADADVRTLSEKPYVTRGLDRARAAHATHTEYGDRAARLAEMWARVARSL
jgi:hypothetical protein